MFMYMTLTFRITSTWDVDPPCTKVAYTISALLKHWHPGSTYVPANQLANEVHYKELILHWHQYHSDTRAIIMDEFLVRFISQKHVSKFIRCD